MRATITKINEVLAHPDTASNEWNMSLLSAVVSYDVKFVDGTTDQLETGIRPGENNTWNLKIIEALQDWRDRGGIIPEWIPPTAEDIRATMPNVSARQLRHGLLNVELEEADVDAVIAAIPDDDERKRASIDWRTANEFERLHPLVVQLSAALGLSPEVVDDLWGFFQTI